MQAPEFSVEIHDEVGPDGAVLVVAVVGDLDYAHVDDFDAAVLPRLAAAGALPRVVVDLTEVPYCDSCGLRVLLGASQQVTRAGGELVLRGVGSQPARALRLTGLDAVLPDVGGAGTRLDAPTPG